ncbi:MAG: hydantoinase B/oxoprolinase family protein [Rhodospirillales bacterium]|jgi:N-methylhydantoinase B|nr:hydantoinase B/oxoprolinase family protein [Rhodospirillales bacterium]MBT4006922.1 hydantoinase B/oxoprolinase family protein [Rhodospirillales bacterium]MBT5113051.1 hydantoinase B/oxoprolinase family protein [Rhodospirillales bacterium]MBT5672927.1 hydantoinase B/oxoprolinase family protein [Rhodospirillales bacterium]MBT6187604.1 hydantoinase B/oxoprolinase family protein [Rhodospirillales bacterium]
MAKIAKRPAQKKRSKKGSKPGIDPITFQVIKASLVGIVREMQNCLFRTGFSTIIRESQDASCALMNAKGEVVAQHVVLPLHVGAFPHCTAAVLRDYGDDIAPGDAYIINHTYEGGSPHAPDMAVITPIFAGSQLIGFSGNIAHKPDLGGVVPGSCYALAKEIFAEGLHLPAIRYQRDGKTLHEVDKILAANSRTPEMVLGDIRGQVGADRLGEGRVGELVTKYGADQVMASFDELMRVSEGIIRAAMRTWKDGRYEAERFVDNDGIDLDKPIRVHVVLEKKGDRISFDFTGSNDQTRGPANIRPPLVQAAMVYTLISQVDPTITINSGLLKVAEVKLRKGSVLDPHFPAPVNTYMPTVTAVTEATVEAISNIVPECARADGCGSRSIIIGGRSTRSGKGYVQYEIVGGGTGGRAMMDGVSGTCSHQSNARIAPIEIVESEFPTRVKRFELIPDSGGPGAFRGGLGILREYENLAEARFTIRSNKHFIAPRGVRKGSDGRCGRLTMHPDTKGAEILPSRYSDYPLMAGNIFRLESPGGGGFGDPRKRDPQSVCHDVNEGYVSAKSAKQDYRVALKKSKGAFIVDLPATKALRKAKR